MRKFLNLTWLVLLFGIVLASCNKDDDNVLAVDEDWKKANGEAFTLRGLNLEKSGFKKLDSQSGDGYILYRVIKEGTDTTKIYYTSKIKSFYKGCLIKDEDGNLIEDLDSVLVKGVVFDQKMDEEGYDPAEFEVSGLIDGWTTALQHMHVGDRWEIWIPYQLGYGVSGSSGGTVTILPYSTLVFDMEVTEITEQ